MDPNYRHEARQCLLRAKNELGSNDDQRLKFAALELRMAMECLTYDRALAFKDEIPPSEYDTWQPKKVLSMLLEIDPTADKDSTLAFGSEEVPGQPAVVMHSLGSEKVLNMSVLRKNYDALGSYLHVQTIKQARDGKPLDFNKFRARCEELTKFVEQVLASPFFNAVMGSFAEMDCSGCRQRIRKRIPLGQKEVKVECFNCLASYTLSDEGEGKVLWKPNIQELKCANTKCACDFDVWVRELMPGASWKCPVCQGLNVLRLSLHFKEEGQNRHS